MTKSNNMKKKIRLLTSLLTIIALVVMLTNSCKKEENNDPANSVRDIDGNLYHTVTIGTQVWMVENLNVTHYINGDTIANITNNSGWYNLDTGAYCDYDNTPRNSTIYGKLYNWYAINDNRRITPIGWHVASDDDWTQLEKYLEANTGTVGSVAKIIASTINWRASSNPAGIGYEMNKNNSSGFTALPGGCRAYNGEFIQIGDVGNWWCSTVYNLSNAYSRSLNSSSGDIHSSNELKKNGLSVRCLKD